MLMLFQRLDNIDAVAAKMDTIYGHRRLLNQGQDHLVAKLNEQLHFRLSCLEPLDHS